MTGYIADNGTEITDEMVERWADEAEAGFLNCEVTTVDGRPWEETQPLRPRTIRLSDTMWHLIDQAASARHMSVSAWTRQAMAGALTDNK